MRVVETVPSQHVEISSMFEKCENFGRVLEMGFVRRNFFFFSEVAEKHFFDVLSEK
jgi:hypothetical protein